MTSAARCDLTGNTTLSADGVRAGPATALSVGATA